MKRLFPRVVFPVILSLPQWAVAFTQPNLEVLNQQNTQTATIAVGERVLRPDLSNPLQSTIVKGVDAPVLMKFDTVSKAPRLISILRSEGATNPSTIQVEALQSQAMNFVDANQQLLGLDSRSLDLKQDSVLIADDIQSLSYAVKDSGLTVGDASFIFRFKNGQLVQLVNESFTEAKPTEVASFDLDRLQSYAASVLLADSISLSRELIRVAQTNVGYEKIHVVEFVAIKQDIPYTIQIATNTNEIFEVKAKNQYATDNIAKATVYPRWYGETINWEPLKELQVQKNVFTDDNGVFAGTPDKAVSLSGKRVKVNDKANHPVTLEQISAADGALQLVYQKPTPAAGAGDAHDDRITSQAMVYYHAIQMSKMAENYIPQTKWLYATLTANANVAGGFSGGCNAFWDGSTVNFYVGGSTCGNTGMIADVVYHEWGHGLDQNTGGIDDGAFSEGFGDIMAMIMTRSPEVGKGFFYPDFKPVRNLAQLVTTGGAGWASDPHGEGLIIGGTFWSLYQYLADQYGEDKGTDMVRNMAFKMIYTADKYKQAYDALLVIDDNDGNVANGTPNLCLINKAFSEHKLVEALPQCATK